MKKRKRKGRHIGYCNLCGKKTFNLTSEHVPGKQLFSKGVSFEGFYVESCKRCQSYYKKGEDLFRDRLVFRYDISEHTDVKNHVFPNFGRKFANSFKMQHELQLRRGSTDLKTRGGVILATDWPTLEVPKEELILMDRVIEKTTRAMYFKEKGYCVPFNHDVEVTQSWVSEFSYLYEHMISEKNYDYIMKDLIPLIVKGVEIQSLDEKSGIRRFVSVCKFAEDRSDSGGFIFEFYGKLLFLSIVIENDLDIL